MKSIEHDILQDKLLEMKNEIDMVFEKHRNEIMNYVYGEIEDDE